MDEVRAIKRALNIAEDAKIIISTARFGPVKRVDRVITALPEVFKAVPNSVCLVVGDGSEAQKIDTLCANLGIQDRVIFTGALSNEKVLECLEAADIFVSFGEQSNLGNALLEALSHGKCIVSLDVGGIQEIITAGQNGVLVKETELDKIPHVLIQLLNDDEYRNTLARNAKEFAEHKLLTWEERARKEVCLIEELVNHT
jgi:glycosyltransferase involved in cell wall biosynthesis